MTTELVHKEGQEYVYVAPSWLPQPDLPEGTRVVIDHFSQPYPCARNDYCVARVVGTDQVAYLRTVDLQEVPQ